MMRSTTRPIVADFLTGDDDALVARWFAEDCVMESGSGTFEGREGMRRFLAWAHDGVRECPRSWPWVQQGATCSPRSTWTSTPPGARGLPVPAPVPRRFDHR
jgi:hypothetical protein